MSVPLFPALGTMLRLLALLLFTILATGMSAPESRLDSSKVPSDLVDLVPLAEKWGIGDDLIREDFQSKATVADKQALAKALTGRNTRITQWLDSLPKDAPMSEEAAAFMYMQLGLDEMGLWTD